MLVNQGFGGIIANFIMKISALFEISCFKKGAKHRSLHRTPEQRGSNLGDS